MKPRNIAAIFALLSMCPTAGAALADKEPLRLKPASNWVTEYQKQGCRLARQFGEGETKAIATFSRFGPGDNFRLTLAGRMFNRPVNGSVALQFGPSEAEQQVEYFAGDLGNNMPALVMAKNIRIAPPTDAEASALKKAKMPEMVDMVPIGAVREAAITYLQIGKPLKQPVILELGKMDAPMAALSKCVDDLMAGWGIDVAKHKALKKRALPSNDPQLWLTNSDYPRGMLASGQPALIEFRLDLDDGGKVTGCHIQESTRPKDFDNAVCGTLMRRAKFTPAIDAGGRPLRSYWKSTVRFQTP
jgi:hypothetical protein